MINKPIVLHILTSLDFGGVESHVQLIGENVHLLAFDHVFCAISGGGVVQRRLQQLGRQVDTLGCNPKIPSVSAIIALYKYLKKHKPQIVHLRGAEANFHGIIAARMAGIPIVIAEEIGIPQHSVTAKKIFSLIYYYSDRIVAISQAVKDSIVASGEAKVEQVQVIYNPFEPQKFAPLAERIDKLKLGFVGRLEPVKNPIATIEAASILEKKGLKIELHIIGNGSLYESMQQRIYDLELTDKVTLHGFQHSPFEILKGCHFYLQPSISEGFGLAVCEAMSAGLPVIASAVGGVPEIIEHDKTGWLLKNPTPEELANTILYANKYSDDELQSIANKASDDVRQRFGIEKYLNQLDALYHSLAS